jgi:hypothetical protein
MNIGLAIEIDTPGINFTKLFDGGKTDTLPIANNALSSSSSGAVRFVNNMCQLENRAAGMRGIFSVAILSRDHLIFSNNHIWLDGPYTAYMDAVLLADSIQVSSNRFQEAPGSVVASGVTFGVSNITTHNTSTFCLVPLGFAALSLMTPNVIFDATLCPKLTRQ